MDASGRSRVETHIVVGNINDKVLAPDKTWFQKVLDAAPVRKLNGGSAAARVEFMITIQTNYKPRSRGEGSKVQDAFHRGLEALFYDDRQLARCIKMGCTPTRRTQGLRFQVRPVRHARGEGQRNIGIEYGPRSGGSTRTSCSRWCTTRVQFDGKKASDFLIKFMQTEGRAACRILQGRLVREEYQKTAVRPIRRKDALGMQWTGKETGYRKRETARQMHVDVKIAAAEQP
eukprot:tig00000551_g2052.t1